jgi:hypothetical protein
VLDSHKTIEGDAQKGGNEERRMVLNSAQKGQTKMLVRERGPHTDVKESVADAPAPTKVDCALEGK